MYNMKILVCDINKSIVNIFLTHNFHYFFSLILLLMLRTIEPSSTGFTIKVCVFYACLTLKMPSINNRGFMSFSHFHYTAVMVLPSKKYIIDYNENSYRYV